MMAWGQGIVRSLRAVLSASVTLTAVLFVLPRAAHWAEWLVERWVRKTSTPEADLELMRASTMPFAFYSIMVGAAVVGALAVSVAVRYLRTPALLSAATGWGLVASSILLRRTVHGPKWLFGAILFLLASVAVTRRERPADTVERSSVVPFLLAAEGGALALAFVFPHAEHHGSFAIVGYALGFGAAALATARLDEAKRLRIAALGLPVLVLPLSGLARNPSTTKLVLALSIAYAIAAAVNHRFPRAIKELEGFSRQHGAWLAVTSVSLLFVLPFGFRDLANSDWMGHEGQHLGWINSITHGRWMMADAGFTYGPLREYLVALVATCFGGLNLEHVRLGHVVVNLIGLAAQLAAIQRCVGRRLDALVLGAVLLFVHSALTSFVVYFSTYSFGWADSLRAGAGLLAIALACGGVPTRRTRIAAGLLTAFGVLYSHDFGLLALVGALLGIVAEQLAQPGQRRLDRLRSAGVEGGIYLLATVAGVALFVIVYVASGRGHALFDGYRWTARVALGMQAYAHEPYPIDDEILATPEKLLDPVETEGHMGLCRLDYLVIPLIPVLGLVNAASALGKGTFRRSSALVLALSVFAFLVQRHPMLSADGWHNANSAGPCCVLVVLLFHESGGAAVRVGRRLVRWGPAAVVAATILWLRAGELLPLEERIQRLTSGAEHPSFGEPYAYPELPRAGDVHVTSDHLEVVTWIRQHSGPEDRILSSTWMLGGGTELFLADRGNSTPFDNPAECIGPRMRARALEELELHPPAYVIGDFWEYYGPDVQAWVNANYERQPLPFRAAVWARRPPPP